MTPPGINAAITAALVFAGALHHPKSALTVIATSSQLNPCL
jgi:hypothetical protein